MTGAGGHFCAGADLKAMAAGHPDDEWTPAVQRRTPTCTGRRCCATSSPSKPLIAAVEGYAVAGGTEILQAMDIRVAGESATFGVAEVRRGLFPLGGSTVRLPRQIPYTIAAELLLTGRLMPAEEAKEVGLIGHVVPDGQALAKARELADQIAGQRPARRAGRAQASASERRDLPEEEAPGPRARARLARVRQQRRQGGPDGLRREARPATSPAPDPRPVLCTLTSAWRTSASTDRWDDGDMAIARWKDLCIDATDAHRMARFWGDLLGLEVELHDDGDAALRGATPEQTIWVNAVPEPRTVKQRVHLDVETASLDPILALGATVRCPASESGFSWDVLADPEGGELCAFVRGDGPTRLYEMGVDTADAESAARLARWWADVIGGERGRRRARLLWIQAVPACPSTRSTSRPSRSPRPSRTASTGTSPATTWTGWSHAGATVIGERPDWPVLADPEGEVHKGPAPIDIGQVDVPWVVMADPEGNEFCVFPAGSE